MVALLHAISFAVGYEVRAVEERRQNGFTKGLVVHVWREREFLELCVICWGGEAQKGRAMINVSGKSCGVIADWKAWTDLLEHLPEVRLTRVDVAVDLHDGAYTVDDALEWVRQGQFNCSGRNPSTRVDGDWVPMLNDEEKGTQGRTLYVGKSKNGKGLRVYEKGKQLGQVDSNWNRFEVQFGNRDRVIPFEILTDPTRFFVASYPALEQIIDVAGERISTISNTASITIQKILTYTKSTVGKWINLLVDSGVEVAELVEEIRVREIPRRVQPSAVAAGLLPEATRSGFMKWKEQRCLMNKCGSRG